MDNQPEFYSIIPEFNGAGRLCNYHTFPVFADGDSPVIVRVPAEEWERFNILAGRRHRIAGGVVVYDPALEPCMPDGYAPPPEQGVTLEELAAMFKILTGGV